jgi:hypothetical protein
VTAVAEFMKGIIRNHRKAISYAPEPDDRLPCYLPRDLLRMDSAFQKRMLAAIERGEECAPTSVSTAPGTKYPILIRPE